MCALAPLDQGEELVFRDPKTRGGSMSQRGFGDATHKAIGGPLVRIQLHLQKAQPWRRVRELGSKLQEVRYGIGGSKVTLSLRL